MAVTAHGIRLGSTIPIPREDGTWQTVETTNDRAPRATTYRREERATIPQSGECSILL